MQPILDIVLLRFKSSRRNIVPVKQKMGVGRRAAQRADRKAKMRIARKEKKKEKKGKK